MSDEESIETRTTLVRRRADGIVEHRDKPRARLDLEDARAMLEATRQLMAGRLPCPVLVVPGTAEEVTKAAREYLSQHDEARETVSRAAFVVESPLSRVIAAVFLGLKRPKYPAAAFRNEAEAVAWLHSA